MIWILPRHQQTWSWPNKPVYSISTRRVNTLRPRQNWRHFADDIFKWIFLNENVWISIEMSLKFVPRGPINNIPALVQIMAWHRPGDKPLSESIMVRFSMHLCDTRPQWVKRSCTVACITASLKMFFLGGGFVHMLYWTDLPVLLLWFGYSAYASWWGCHCIKNLQHSSIIHPKWKTKMLKMHLGSAVID